MHASMPAPSPLVGRDREFDILRRQLDAALAGHGSIVLISGEAGIGKTALAETLCQEAADGRALVLVGRCYDLTETPAYGPWAEVGSQFPPALGLPPLPSTQNTTAQSPQQFFAEVRAFFAAASAKRPIVLLLDDLQWADPVSLDLLRFLSRSLSPLSMLVLATYRPDALDRHHPLSALLPLLVRESRAERLDLAPLPSEAVHELVHGRFRLRAPDEGRLVEYLLRRTEGNALFVGELLRAIEERGVVAAGGSTLGDLETMAVPTLLRQVVEGRVARLGPEAERLLGIAAVIGQDVPLGIWTMVGETDAVAIEEVAEQGLGARLLVEERGGQRVAFAHALIREALYEGIPAIRRRRIHRRVGEALIASVDPLPDAVAYHFRQAGDARATGWLAKAGWQAYRSFAYQTARLRFDEALPAITGAERASALMALATLDRFQEQGVRYAESAVEAACAIGDEILVAVARFRLSITLIYRGRIGEALTTLERAKETLDPLPDAALPDFFNLWGLTFSRERRQSFPPCALAYSGRWREALTLLGSTLDDPWRGIAETDTNGNIAMVYVAAFLGRPDIIRRSIEKSIAGMARREDDLGVLAASESGIYRELHPFLLDSQEARRWYDDVVGRAARRVEEAYGAVPPHLNRCPLLVTEGRWEQAWALWAQRRDAAYSGDVAWNFPHIGAMARAQGRRGNAWALVREGLPDGPATMPGTTHFTALDLQCLAARLALDEGKHAGARQWLEAHDRWLEWAGPEARWGRADGQIAWATYYRAIGEPETALHYAERALADATEPRQPLALLTAHRLLGELDTDAGAHKEAGRHLGTSLALADACQAPYERALTLLAMAEMERATGDRDAARALLDEVKAICEPLGAEPALARVAALAGHLDTESPAAVVYPAGLSAREVEVLRLVAEGLSNPQVGARLFLSPRTVEQHLRSVFHKTGVTSRVAAARWAADHALV